MQSVIATQNLHNFVKFGGKRAQPLEVMSGGQKVILHKTSGSCEAGLKNVRIIIIIILMSGEERCHAST